MADDHELAFRYWCKDEGEDFDAFDEMDYAPLYGEGVGYEWGQCEYAVLSEAEADRAWEESLDSYLEECVLPEVPESMRYYFDEEKWKRDARFDGRGHALGSYDGNEYEVQVGDDWYYIYRIN